MTPATAFTKAVCERASKDGWVLKMFQMGFHWKHKSRKERDPQVYLCESRQEMLWAACCDLQQREYPDLKVTID